MVVSDFETTPVAVAVDDAAGVEAFTTPVHVPAAVETAERTTAGATRADGTDGRRPLQVDGWMHDKAMAGPGSWMACGADTDRRPTIEGVRLSS